MVTTTSNNGHNGNLADWFDVSLGPVEMERVMNAVTGDYTKNPQLRMLQAWDEAARHVIACCILNPDLVNQVHELEKKHFRGEWSDVWNAILTASVNEVVDMPSVIDLLPTKYTAAMRYSISQDITATQNITPTESYYESYVNKLFKFARRASDLEAGLSLAKAALDERADLDRAESEVIDALVNTTADGNEITWMADVAPTVTTEIERNIANPTDVRGLCTGLHSLDRSVGGFEQDKYVIVGGRPSMGKSTLVFRMALGLAEAGHPGLILTSETSKRMFLIRLLCSQLRINYQREFKTGQLFPGNETRHWNGYDMPTWDVVRLYLDRLQQLPIAHVPAHFTPRKLYGLVHRMKRSHGIQWLVADTLNLVQADIHSDNENAKMTSKSAHMALIAHELEVLTIVTWQLSRRVESTATKLPNMADLRDSGSGEQDGDVIMFAYRPEYYRSMGEQCQGALAGHEMGDNEMALKLAKNRDGATNVFVFLRFDPQYARIDNLELRHERG